jgi:hypothetical protein
MSLFVFTQKTLKKHRQKVVITCLQRCNNEEIAVDPSEFVTDFLRSPLDKLSVASA